MLPLVVVTWPVEGGVVTPFLGHDLVVLFGLKRCRDPVLRSPPGLALRVSRHGFDVATWPRQGLE